MRILKTVHSLAPSAGGVATAVDALSRAQLALGHIIEVACLDDPVSPWLTGRPYPVHAFASKYLQSYGWSPDFARWLDANVSRFDVIVVEGLWQFHGHAVHAAATRANIPYAVYPHGMLDPWFRKAYPAKHLKKMLYWFLCESRVLRDARAVIFTSEEERRLAENAFAPWNIRPAVAPLGVAAPGPGFDLRKKVLRERFPAFADKPYLLFLGRMDPKKGSDLLIEAYASVYPQSARADGEAPVLVLAGPGNDSPFASHCHSLASRLGLRENADIFWTGMVEGDAKWAALESASALVLPSHQENFGYVVVEALACGTPVLISECVNIWREVSSAGAGLAAPDDLEGTRKLLATHSAWTPAERAQMSSAAKKCFDACFRLEDAARRQLAVLSQTA